MVVLTIASLLSFFSNEHKSVSRGEDHIKSKHVESLGASQGILKGQVHASMKKAMKPSKHLLPKLILRLLRQGCGLTSQVFLELPLMD